MKLEVNKKMLSLSSNSFDNLQTIHRIAEFDLVDVREWHPFRQCVHIGFFDFTKIK